MRNNNNILVYKYITMNINNVCNLYNIIRGVEHSTYEQKLYFYL